MIKIRKGLNLPLAGAPEQAVYDGGRVSKVAIIGPDYAGMKPTMSVQVGDQVKKGQLLFNCKKQHIAYTSPAAGKVLSVNRGAKRVFESIVIEVDKEESQVELSSYKKDETITEKYLIDLLKESGLWTALRARPFNKCAIADEKPVSLFVTAIDTNPHAPSVDLVLSEQKEAFEKGLAALKVLAPKTYLCTAPESQVAKTQVEGVEVKNFSGPHPAGLVGTHIHFIEGVGKDKIAWHINYQDVVAVGHLVSEGKIYTDRIVSVAGPGIKKPRLLRSRVGASISELVANELRSGQQRTISGPVISGRTAAGSLDFLGRYHNQVSAINEGGDREFLGWCSPGFDKFSTKNIFLSKLNFGKLFNFTSSTNGSPRAMVPIGMYENIMPLDINATYLLRALLSKDTDGAQDLGCLELAEEDLALATFVCPGKIDYGPILRDNLTTIERDG